MTKLKMRPWVATVFAAVLIGVLAACGGPGGDTRETSGPPKTWDEIVAAAKDEGSVTVWTVQNPTVNQNLKAGFETAYPDIDINFAQYTPADLFPKVEVEQATGSSTADVLVQTDRFWHAQHEGDGWFRRIVGPEVIGADELVRDGSAPTTDGATISSQLLYDNDTRVLSLYSPWGYAWNTKTTPSIPSFGDLFDGDTYKGKIAVYDPDTSPINVEFIDMLDKRYPNLIDRLGKLDPVIFALAGAVSESLAAGDVDAALGISQTAVAGKPNVGFAYDSNYPAPGTPVYSELLANSAHPNAAQVFLNWALSVDGQQVWSEGAGSVRPDGAGQNALSSNNIEVFEPERLSEDELAPRRTALNQAYGR